MRAVWIILGIVGVLVGALWTLQGLNIIKSGFMAGDTMWAIIGPIVVVVGLLLLLYGSRSRKTRAE